MNYHDSLPLVSIITPSYNAEKYIEETINSVKYQDYPAIEHIVIDGNSKDKTLDIIKNHSELRWISEEDRGQSEALNKGFQLANGEIIGWLNADDCYSLGAVHVAVNFFMNNDDIDILYSDMEIIDEQTQIVDRSWGKPFDRDLLLVSNFINQPTLFMRKRVLQNLRGVDESLKYVMDRELWLRASDKFNFKYLEGEVLAKFRYCQGTKSFDFSYEFRKEWIRVLERHMKFGVLKDMENSKKERIIRINRSKFAIGLMVKEINKGNWHGILPNLLSAIRNNHCLLINPGLYKIVLLGIIGQAHRRTRSGE